ncbi:LamG domain-containing protein [Paenibacillus thalictri]|uniref:LamG domain-containing protein n=2 Tax=Paenibacillus thalictri TaxID=2527873 RepID=A0A4Q9DN92_9BACL|nr:LamG domain-containing protein [Paenibacillus thalictri]
MANNSGHGQMDVSRIVEHPDLVSFWDFQEEAGEPRIAKGPFRYALTEMNGPIARIEAGVCGPYAASIEFGQWLNLPRRDCPALDFHGPDAQLTIIAWLKRADMVNRGCQAVAGMWNESEKKRQYCLFMDLRIWESGDQLGGHVSSVGGPTPGHPWCMTTAIGATPVSKAEWHAAAFTYDGLEARVYLDGVLDRRDVYNPYAYPEGLFDGGPEGADFTVAAVHRSGEMGNFYAGLIGGLAVFKKALNEEEIARLGSNG